MADDQVTVAPAGRAAAVETPQNHQHDRPQDPLPPLRSLVEHEQTPQDPNDDGVAADAEPLDASRKKSFRGRHVFLRGLSRISSSPALAQLGRPRAASSPYGAVSSFSCVSLASGAGSSPSPFGAQTPLSTSDLSRHHSPPDTPSACTSVSGIPALGAPQPCDGIEARLAIRRVDGAEAAAALSLAGQNATASLPAEVKPKKTDFNMWANMPHEMKIHVFSFLLPRELVRASRASRDFHRVCFDGQLWTRFDASEFYREIPADSLAKIIVAAGPFIKDLNLRGCVQVEHYKRAEAVVKACRNLVNATLEGCLNFQHGTLHNLLRTNGKLARLNLTGLSAVTNTTCRIVAEACPQLEMLNVSWCANVDARGIKAVVERCPRLTDLRAGEVKGFGSREVAEAIFRTNNLTRLVLSGCGDLSDTALRTMLHGSNPEMDILTERPVVAPRRLRHLDLSRCVHLTSHGVRALGHLVPDLEGLQLGGCSALTDAALEPVLASTPRLTHLELEDIPELTNTVLSDCLAKAPCAPGLQHLTVSYCEHLGDQGLLPVMRACHALRVVEMDNTRVSDLVLAEAAAMVRARSARTKDRCRRARPSLSLVVYDCQNVTWTGIREVLSRNAEVITPRRAMPSQSTVPQEQPRGPLTMTVTGAAGTNGAAVAPLLSFVADDLAGLLPSSPPLPPLSLPEPPVPPKPAQTYPTEIISLKCFYGWQMTVDEHTKRVMRGDLAAAARLERKWADYMQATEEAGAGGAGVRRRRRRAREAQLVHADEEEAGAGGVFGGMGGRRRARTAACTVM